MDRKWTTPPRTHTTKLTAHRLLSGPLVVPLDIRLSTKSVPVNKSTPHYYHCDMHRHKNMIITFRKIHGMRITRRKSTTQFHNQCDVNGERRIELDE